MDDYISREAAKEFLKRAIFGADNKIDKWVDSIPAADVRPVNDGENITENNPVDEFVCSKCGIILEDWSMVEIDEDDGERTNHEYVFRFCPNCGAKMEV